MAGRFLVALLSLASLAVSEEEKVLFLTHSAGYVHKVVARPEPGTLALAERKLAEAARGRFDVVATQDCATITAENLAGYDVVAFYTTGELPVSDWNRHALLDFVRNGGGFVGIHPATDTLYKFADYGGMVGGYFWGHPWHEDVVVTVEHTDHPSTAHLGRSFEIKDEIYQFRDWRRDNLTVLLSLDITSVDVNRKGVRRADRDFALAWCRSYEQGRVFYTALGHRAEVWHDERFLRHVLGGIEWAGRAPRADAEGFVPLEGRWKQAGPGGFEVKEGVATSYGGMGLRYFEQEFRNFVLRLRFRQDDVRHNSGVFIRFPHPGDDPWVAVKQGYEIQIAGDRPAKNTTGAVYDFQAAQSVPLRPAGEWNDYEITCIGRHYYVRLNGQLVNTFTGDRGLKGMIGVQNHDAKSKVAFRDIRVRELPDDAVALHVLFDGKRDGWKMCGPGEFDLAHGVLTSRGGMGMYWHERPFRDFILMLDWKVGRKEDNAGVFVRFPDPGDDPWVAVKQGYELQICDTAQAKHRTGSVYSFADARAVPTRRVGEWNHYEIRVVGQRYAVKVNGQPVTEFPGDRSREGHVGLQNHDDQSRVSFRNVRVIELKARRR